MTQIHSIEKINELHKQTKFDWGRLDKDSVINLINRKIEYAIRHDLNEFIIYVEELIETATAEFSICSFLSEKDMIKFVDEIMSTAPHIPCREYRICKALDGFSFQIVGEKTVQKGFLSWLFYGGNKK